MPTKKTIVFIHGLWMHANTWEPWMEFFNAQGYTCLNPPWPGDGATVAASRANPQAMANYGVQAIADSYANVIGNLKEPSIVIGHSFGGLLAQILLGRGLAAAAVAIDPAPMKGVWQLPFTVLRSALPILSNPFNLRRSVSLTYPQFRYAFANRLPEDEAKDLYARCTVPSPARPLFQAAMATLNPNAETRVNTANATRGPLLITAGEHDHIVPPLLSKAAFRKYRHSPAVTDFVMFADRGHSLASDHGWKEVAEYVSGWLGQQGL